MKYIRSIMLVIGIALFVLGCSNSDDELADSSSVGEMSDEEAIKELKEETGIDIEAIEEEMGMDKSDDVTIPDEIPSDVPLPDDMEVDFTIDNELMAQAWLLTELTRDELMTMYEDYLNSNFSGEISSEDNEMDGYYTITYTVPYKDSEFLVQIIDDEDESKRTVTLTVTDFLME